MIKRQRTYAHFAAAIPLLLLIYWVMKFNVNMPFWDQWDIYDVVLSKRTVTLSDLWFQNNEHRSFFPKLLWWGLASLSNWDVRWEVLCGLAAGIGSFLLIFHQIKRLELEKGQSFPVLFWIAISLLFFSMTQRETWLWGMTSSSLLQILAVLAGFSFLTQWERRLQARDYLLAILCGILASFSFGSGLLYWPVGCVAIISAPASYRGRFLAIWVSITLLVIAMYFSGYRQPPHTSGPLFGLQHPIRLLEYAVLFIGAPLCPRSVGGAMTCGITGLMTFLCALWILRDRAKAKARGTDFFLLLAFYITLVALMAGAGRLEIGLAEALSSRYIPFGTLFWISLIVILLNENCERRWQKIIWQFVLAGVIGMGGIGYKRALPACQHHAAMLRHGRDYFLTHQSEEWGDHELKAFHPNPQKLKTLLLQAARQKQGIFR